MRGLISCALADGLVRKPVLGPIVGWNYYDWSTTDDGPWSRVYARHDRRVVVAAITDGGP